jgi:hypothetical protein
MKQQQNTNLSLAVAAAAQEQEQRRDYDADADEGLSQDGNEGAIVTQVKAIVGSYLHCLGDLYLIDLYSDHYGRSTSTKLVPNTFVEVECRPQQQEQGQGQGHYNDSILSEKRIATFDKSLSDTAMEASSVTTNWRNQPLFLPLLLKKARVNVHRANF